MYVTFFMFEQKVSFFFISSAIFWRKLIFVHSLGSLSSHIPVDYIYIPDEVMKYVWHDTELMKVFPPCGDYCNFHYWPSSNYVLQLYKYSCFSSPQVVLTDQWGLPIIIIYTHVDHTAYYGKSNVLRNILSLLCPFVWTTLLISYTMLFMVNLQ